MTREPMWRRYQRFWRADPDRDVRDEIDFHFEARLADLQAEGCPMDEARRRAREEFGDVEAVRARLTSIDRQLDRRRHRATWMDTARQDVRFALRSVRRHPGFAVALVLTLALGIGAAGSMYGLMWRLLLQPAPYVVEPERVAQIFLAYGRPGDANRHVNRWAYGVIERLRAGVHAIEVIGASLTSDVTLGTGAAARQVRAVTASGDYWRVLGVRPRSGRFFTEAESHPATGSRVVVLSHALWRDAFGGGAVDGLSVTIRGATYDVIGVAPRGFRGIGLEQVDIWLPLIALSNPAERTPWYTTPFNSELSLVTRLAAGVSAARAEREVAAVVRPYLADVNREVRFAMYPDSLPAVVAPLTTELGRGAEGKPEARVVAWLVGVGLIMLLVAASNVAGLLVLRSLARRREVAVRSALGMTRRRLAALVLTETFVLAVTGGAAGLVLLATGGRWLERLVFPHLTWEAPGALDPARFLLVGVGVLLAFVLAGLVTLAHTPRDVSVALKDSATRSATKRSLLHRAILVGQTMLSFVLLVGAALFIRSLGNLTGEDIGVDARRAYSVYVDFSGMGRSRADIAAFYERGRERVAAIPGVGATSLGLTAPLLRFARAGGSIRLPGVDSVITLPGSRAAPLVNYVTPDFFETVGMSVLRGRTFQDSERNHGLAVIMNRTMADAYWPGRDPVGQCVLLDRQPVCATVVGVVEPQRLFRIQEEPRMYYYRPLPRNDAEIGTLLLRSSLSPGRTALLVRRALLEVDPALPFVDVSELATGLEAELRPWRLGVTIFTAFGGLAMLLAAVGLGSAIAYAVNERSREIGLRIAVGARYRNVLTLILREGLAIGVAGVAAGLLIAIAAAPQLGDLLYKQAPRDAGIMALVSFVVIAIAVLASLAPAIRATRIDPMRVLAED